MAEFSQEFEVYVCKDDLKFSCAHFIAYAGFRERLHGHNYNLSVKLIGGHISGGYLIDFGVVKKTCRKLCKGLHESFICPSNSTAIQILVEDGQARK